MKLNYTVVNEDKTKNVIVLHGLLGEGSNFQTIATKYLANYKVYLIDHRNHGASPHDMEHNYFLMKEDVKELLDDLGIKKTHVIGHSMGGKVAMAFTDSYPQYVEQLVVMDILPKKYAVYTPTFEAMKSLDLTNPNKQELSNQLASKLGGNVGLAQYLLKNLKKEGDGFAWKINLDGLIRNAFNISDKPPISQIKVPTLLIRGMKSEYVLDEYIESYVKPYFSNYRLIDIADAGHWVHGDKPAETCEAILNFLK